MRKATRFLLIPAVAVAGLSVLAWLVCMIFQRAFLEVRFGSVAWNYDGVVPVFPVGDLVYAFMVFVVMVVLIFLVCNGKISLWLDVLAAFLLAAGLPLIRWMLNLLQTWLVPRLIHVDAYQHLSMVRILSDECLTFMTFAVGLALVACGMSIATKYLIKKKL